MGSWWHTKSSRRVEKKRVREREVVWNNTLWQNGHIHVFYSLKWASIVDVTSVNYGAEELNITHGQQTVICISVLKVQCLTNQNLLRPPVLLVFPFNASIACIDWESSDKSPSHCFICKRNITGNLGINTCVFTANHITNLVHNYNWSVRWKRLSLDYSAKPFLSPSSVIYSTKSTSSAYTWLLFLLSFSVYAGIFTPY